MQEAVLIKSRIVQQEGWHDLLFEPEYKEVYADVAQWIHDRV